MPLSTGEYELLLALAERPQGVLGRDQSVDLTRWRAAAAFNRSIDIQVSRLRKKLQRDPADPQIIKTIRCAVTNMIENAVRYGRRHGLRSSRRPPPP